MGSWQGWDTAQTQVEDNRVLETTQQMAVALMKSEW